MTGSALQLSWAVARTGPAIFTQGGGEGAPGGGGCSWALALWDDRWSVGVKRRGRGGCQGRPDENETDWYRADLIQVYWGDWGGFPRWGELRSGIFMILMLMRNITNLKCVVYCSTLDFYSFPENLCVHVYVLGRYTYLSYPILYKNFNLFFSSLFLFSLTVQLSVDWRVVLANGSNHFIYDGPIVFFSDSSGAGGLKTNN